MGTRAWGHGQEAPTPSGHTGLQSPLPGSRASERVSGRGGSGHHRWGDREGRGAERRLSGCALEARLLAEKVPGGDAQPGLGSLSLCRREWSQSLGITSVRPIERAGAGDPGGVSCPSLLLASSLADPDLEATELWA